MVFRIGSLCLMATVACGRLVDLGPQDVPEVMTPGDDGEVGSDPQPPGQDDDPLTFRWTDDFERSVPSGLGAPATGSGAYACLSAGTPTVSVSGGVGRLTMVSTGGVERDVQCQIIDTAAGDIDIEAVFHATIGVGSLSARVAGDYTRYNLGVNFWSGGVTLSRFRQAAFTSFTSGSVPLAQDYHVRLRVEGPPTATEIAATVWPVGTQEPATPTLTFVDNQGLVGSGYGVNAWMLDGTMNLTVDDVRARVW